MPGLHGADIVAKVIPRIGNGEIGAIPIGLAHPFPAAWPGTRDRFPRRGGMTGSGLTAKRHGNRDKLKSGRARHRLRPNTDLLTTP